MADDEAGLTLERWGTRFVDHDTERAYLAWHTTIAIPFMRLGTYLSIADWLLATPLCLMTRQPGSGAMALVVMVVLMPLIIAALIVSFRPSLYRTMAPLVVLANMAAGLTSVVSANYWAVADPAHHGVETPLLVAALVNYYGFGIFRLRPLAATIAVAPYMLLAGGWLAAHASAGRLANAFVAVDFLLLSSAFVTGLMLNVFFDVTSRRTFRQERIIVAQKARIEEAEAALQRELSHQVAQRSRDLGAALGRRDPSAGTIDVSPGARLDSRYEIVRALGEGGMGTVYEVKRVTDGQSLALKLVSGPVSRASAQRFAREAEIGARLRHSNLVPIVDVGLAANGAPFLVMELVRGLSLEQQRERFGDASWALPILRQIARGLAALHAANVVHRDLKPANVLLTGDDGAPHARIADFGISRMSDAVVDGSAPTAAKLTGTNAMLGTPLYMAPELAHGRAADAPADVFAFGIVAYEMLSARPPFAMPPILVAMAGQELPTPVAIAHSLVLRCMSPDPQQRPSAEALAAL